jgi:uncharacterized membrane protein
MVCGICKHITILIFHQVIFRLVAPFIFIFPLYRFLMFLFSLFVARTLIPSFRYNLFLFLKCLLHCSYYPHLFHLDPVTTAILVVSFDLIILSILHQTMAYASSNHNSLDPIMVKFFYFSLIVSQALLNFTSAPKSSKDANLCCISYSLALGI